MTTVRSGSAQNRWRRRSLAENTVPDSFDLTRYLERIRYSGSTAATLSTLNALTEAHAESVPFENVDVLLRRAIHLEPAALYEKIVTHQRGGYCFELNGLFLELLQRLGFDARPIGARVRLGEPDRSVLPRRTHLLIEVRIDGATWITDVGVGAASLTHALRLQPDVEQPTPHEPRRLQQQGDRWFHQIRRDGIWSDVYEFTRDDFPLVDRQLANWYTSTCPDSPFLTDLSVALAQPRGERITLKNREFTRRAPDGTTRRHVLESEAQRLRVLERSFGIQLPAGTQLPPK
jgi:N-hydroxyarylamine O-acetyltransferase